MNKIRIINNNHKSSNNNNAINSNLNKMIKIKIYFKQ